jgi:GntR family transcriptional regulator, transcriptional repressor for pyruvate dehydrogenase complex
MVSTPKAESAYQHVAAVIRDQILDGTLAPGDRLPAETSLALAYEVSRSTVREALRVLASQNLVVTTRGVAGGTFINQPETADLTESLSTGIEFLTGAEGLSVDELLEVRILLEVPAAGLAAARVSIDQLEALRAALPARRSEDLSPTFESSRNFHGLIVEAAGNRLLTLVTRPVFEVLQTRVLPDRPPKTFWPGVNSDHAAIFDAIENGDVAAAKAAMAEHLERLRQVYISVGEVRS